MKRSIAILFGLLANGAIAVFGTGILESIFTSSFHAHSSVGIIIKEWLISIILSGLLGVTVQNLWKNRVVRWAWILPSIFFLFGAIVSIFSTANGVVAQLTGYACAISTQRDDCRNFLIFTIPFIRGLVYSIAANFRRLPTNAPTPIVGQNHR